MWKTLAVIAIAACGSKDGPDALASEAHCRRATEKLAKLMTVDTPPPADLIDREVQECTKKYTNAMVDCVIAASDRDSARACYKSHGPKKPGGDDAAMQVKQVAFEAYPLWQTKNPSKSCPTIADLAPFITGNKTTDRWGNELRVYCTGIPAPFGIASSGPDGKPDTADDIKSW